MNTLLLNSLRHARAALYRPLSTMDHNWLRLFSPRAISAAYGWDKYIPPSSATALLDRHRARFSAVSDLQNDAIAATASTIENSPHSFLSNDRTLDNVRGSRSGLDGSINLDPPLRTQDEWVRTQRVESSNKARSHRCAATNPLIASSSPASPPRIAAPAVTGCTTTADEEGAGAASSTSNADFLKMATVHPKLSVFPWRHSNDPLKRLDPSQPEWETKGGLLGPGWPLPMNRSVRASLFLLSAILLDERQWWRIILPWTRNEWLKEMESCFAASFGRAVAGMVEDVYRDVENVGTQTSAESNLEGNQTANADAECNFYDVDFTEMIAPHPVKEGDDGSGKDCDDSRGSTMPDAGRCADEVHFMLERHLRGLYERARESSKSKLNITLRVRPVSARIESMFPIVGLTRELVEDHPALRHSYRNMVHSLERRRREASISEGRRRIDKLDFVRYVLEEINKLMHGTGKLTPSGLHVTTIVAQVSVQCKEIFSVRNLDLDEIIQGDPDRLERDVTHLVRFELIVQTPPDFNSLRDNVVELGRWQITDWDDLLKGNVWFT